MGRVSILAAAMLATAMPARIMAAQYETPINPPDPAAQLAEMIEIYDSICLRAFPDDAAVARAIDARGGAAMNAEEVRRRLHDDPGRGWNFGGRTARFEITIEAGPFHTCAVRTLTAAGFPDLAPYRALAARFEGNRGFQRVAPMTRDVGDLHVTGAGERREGSAPESLLVILTTPGDKTRNAAHSAVEVRFAHQIYAPN
jgi:hypothetical protein